MGARCTLGQVIVDARNLRDGPYLLPTFDYTFVRVTDSSGSSVPTSHFNRQTTIWHDGSSTSYTVTYDFQPERLAILTGMALFVVSILLIRVRRLGAEGLRWCGKRQVIEVGDGSRSA